MTISNPTATLTIEALSEIRVQMKNYEEQVFTIDYDQSDLLLSYVMKGLCRIEGVSFDFAYQLVNSVCSVDRDDCRSALSR